MMKLVIGWTIVLGAIFFGARWMFYDSSEATKPKSMESPAKTADRDEQAITFVSEASPICNRLFSGFLTGRHAGGKALETLWDSTEKRQFDAIFIKDGGDWRLDWNHFVRFSDYP